ncbi:hypothetical protein P9Y62_15960 [Bacillus thuringiensis]|uniref:Uncharacterized protein n=3 Tax=Bacillus thuringiensis TaxID=1428 RepID=A0A9W3NVG9_BACTU|nr:hypothetical protein [Bacillus thuringiensis]EEM38119.1 hypothetical protein bthur0004_60150 [Bacillus thuringiensis serovar sotto str. T04001]MCU5453995.1 hypothetical protein [Bacillus cereus]AFQ13849.1 hypothetical protein BTG_01720 [Bacillus thuringiensis HD-771]MCU5674987.1 hypothetical protein [Bacillus cereus]MDA2097426.1 hypothetical protein [Bacillus cereus]
MEDREQQIKTDFLNKNKHKFFPQGIDTNEKTQEILRKIAELRTHLIESINVSLRPIIGIDWEEFERKEKKASENLGRRGWTLPMNMTPGETIGLSEIADQDELDLTLLDFYSKDEEFEFIKTNILGHELTKEWRELLIQCFDSYEKGSYLIVIPNLLIILENIAHILISPRFQKYLKPDKKTSLKTKYNKVHREIKRDRTYIVFYVSVAAFLNRIFEFGNFDNNPTRLPMINRDWVLHGRDYPKNWKQVDALRLFNALQTIVELDFLLEGLEKEVADVELVK